VDQSDGTPRITEPDHCFDRFVSTYVFDLLAPDFIDQLLSEVRRLLVPEGKLCLVSMTFGASPVSRAVCWGWQRLWRISPSIVGGCHPIEFSDYLPSGESGSVLRKRIRGRFRIKKHDLERNAGTPANSNCCSCRHHVRSGEDVRSAGDNVFD
jgi:hypothetical protein